MYQAPDSDVRSINLALAHGVPLRIHRDGRDLPVYFVQPGELHCTALAEHVGTNYALVLRDLDEGGWADLKAQLPAQYR